MRRLSAGFGMKLPYRAGLEPARDYVTAVSLAVSATVQPTRRSSTLK